MNGIDKNTTKGDRYEPPVAPKSIDGLPFEQQSMVCWFSPKQWVQTGVQYTLSKVFGSYSDKREIQAALSGSALDTEFKDQKDIWIDYIADLGDGWDSTYSMARLIAKPELELKHDGVTHKTKRGHLLVMGGDQVYPTPTRDEYKNRLLGPYGCALPDVPKSRHPWLYAIPGNHDWYDGLTSFLRLFAQNRWIGGWKTRQKRSYFAIQLLNNWWLWGIDIKLTSDIDKNQIEFFDNTAKNNMNPGSKIILCTAEPSWVYLQTKVEGEKAYRNLRYLETTCIEPNNHEVVIGLAGDLHNYTHFSDKDNRKHRFVSGGGGAFLYPTHDMIDSLQLPQCNSKIGGTEIYKRKREDDVYPSIKISRKLRWGSLAFGIWNKPFSFFLGGFYLLTAWILQSTSKNSVSSLRSYDQEKIEFNTLSFIERLAEETNKSYIDWLIDSGFTLWKILAHSPSSVLMFLILIVGLILYCELKSIFGRVVLGGIHAAAHIILLLGFMILVARLNLNVLGMNVDQISQAFLFSFLILLIGGTLGSTVMGLYLSISNVFFKIHSKGVLLCQRNPDYKHFLRMHLNEKGKLTIYPIGIPKVPRKWKFQPGASNGNAWFEPQEGNIESYAEMIHQPIEID